ncbi:hypothetical protein pdam_00012144 [Pocillopora damicornis]|uniref:Uncharacterized protein n=1 Tax=Pocillopora damicornis TaxID=46731 RepID=A0A3M6UKG0_POCDA|nr:hypothetical protein pdam_00012144 [Pocillopora damicornis]
MVIDFKTHKHSFSPLWSEGEGGRERGREGGKNFKLPVLGYFPLVSSLSSLSAYLRDDIERVQKRALSLISPKVIVSHGGQSN